MNFALFLFILLLKAAGMILFILYSGIGLGPDEAQYWTWSQFLDWGYYSKPPGIAWQIWLGTALFGQTELGVRSGAVLIGTLLPIAVYSLARICRMNVQQSCWAGLIMALTPLGILSSFLAITDGGMVLFWTVACIVLLASEEKPKDLLLGVVIACGALFKWTMFYFWIIRLIWGWYHGPIFSKKLFFGLLISLAGLLPSVIWNMQHDWATFKHVFFTIHVQEHSTERTGGNLLEFLAAQIGLMSPAIFYLFIVSLPVLLKTKTPQATCGKITASILGGFTGISAFKRMLGNWCDFAYPSGYVWVTQFTYDRYKHPQIILGGSLALSILLTILAASLPFPYKMNPFKQNIGWNQISSALQEAHYDPQRDFLFGDKYQTASLLSFYGPQQKRAYFLNLQSIRHNQFSYWPGMENEQLGKTGYFVTLESDVEKYQALLQPYFQEIEVVGIKPLVWNNGKIVKSVLILRSVGYNGKKPPEVTLY